MLSKKIKKTVKNTKKQYKKVTKSKEYKFLKIVFNLTNSLFWIIEHWGIIKIIFGF